MEDRGIIEKVEYVQLLIWVIILAIPTALLTLLFLTIYQRGIEFHEYLSESLAISPPILQSLFPPWADCWLGWAYAS
jgi:hypothetical protein